MYTYPRHGSVGVRGDNRRLDGRRYLLLSLQNSHASLTLMTFFICARGVCVLHESKILALI